MIEMLQSNSIMLNLLMALVYSVGGGLFILLVLGCLATTLFGLHAIIRSILAIIIYPVEWLVEKARNK